MTHTFAQTYFPCVTMLNVVVFENHLWTVYSISQKNTCRTVCVYVFDKWYFYNFDLTIGTTFLQNNKSFFGSKTGDRSKLHTPKTSLIIQNRNNQQKKKKLVNKLFKLKHLRPQDQQLTVCWGIPTIIARGRNAGTYLCT